MEWWSRNTGSGGFNPTTRPLHHSTTSSASPDNAATSPRHPRNRHRVTQTAPTPGAVRTSQINLPWSRDDEKGAARGPDDADIVVRFGVPPRGPEQRCA